MRALFPVLQRPAEGVAVFLVEKPSSESAFKHLRARFRHPRRGHVGGAISGRPGPRGGSMVRWDLKGPRRVETDLILFGDGAGQG